LLALIRVDQQDDLIVTHKLSLWLIEAAPASLRVQQGEAQEYSTWAC
jgi:hypothetical protein